MGAGVGQKQTTAPLGWSGPALWAPGVSESRQRGRKARSTWTPVVGLADETSARRWLCGIPLVRSSPRQPSTTVGPGGDAPFAGGGPIAAALAGQNNRNQEPSPFSPLQ